MKQKASIRAQPDAAFVGLRAVKRLRTIASAVAR